MSFFARRAWQALFFSAILSLAQAAFVRWDNCLSESTQTQKPLQLQWVPYFVDAKFDTSSPNNLQLTFYGNVTGQQVEGPYPPPSDPQWDNNDNDFGKIADVGSNNSYSTLFSSFDVLSYNAWNSKGPFCDHVQQGGPCPLGPQFYADPENPSELAAFRVQHNFHSSYQFSTLASTVRLISGDNAAQTLACVTAEVTPDLGTSISTMLTWLPAVVLILKGIATLTAAIWSPWGSSDIFRFSSNYGRDEDLLRLVTPGFGDCLQYIQFVTLVGSLTLQYPGFFQPAVSKTAWSLLLFNQSWVTDGPGTQSLVDGVYMVNGTYGISAMRQLIGLNDSMDVWACMAIWLAIIAAIIIALTQSGFFLRWLHRTVTNQSEEDLRQKNLPFTLGNMIRLLFNFFILPIVALSLFQLVISDRSPTYLVAIAGVFVAVWIVSAGWILWIIFSTRPRTHLFDDMPTVLLYGPLYNTYSDSAAPFAFIPIFITFLRGIAFGAAQPSGTAQIIILAICEIVLIVTLNGFRPFQNRTSMNAYQTFFAAARFITVLLSITFISSLDVGESTRGWIGYTILLIHACVLVFGFFLNSAQTIIEVIARSMGVASQTRGSILNWRMLKKRHDRPATAGERHSMGSHPDLMREDDLRHARSMSNSSQQLLGQQGGHTPSSLRTSGGLDNVSNSGEVGDSPNLGYGYAPVGAVAGARRESREGEKGQADPYYRPPRKRTMTNEALNPVKEIRSEDSPRHQVAASIARSGTDSPRPAFFRDRADSGAQSVRTDYAVREVDQYYRGAALNDQPTRKLKTGPADPESPAATAQSWFAGVWAGFTGKNKKMEAGKGFEVVRSSRMPPEMQQEIARQEELEMQEKPRPEEDETEPYSDSPEMRQEELQATSGATRTSDLSEASAIRSPVEAGGVGRSTSKGAFNFGFDGQNQRMASTGEPLRQDSATARNVSTATAARNPTHPGMRAELSSRRQTQSEDQPPDVPPYDIGLGYITRNSADIEDEYYHDSDNEDPEHEKENDEERFQRTNRFSDFAPSLGPLDLDTGEEGLGLSSFSRFGTQRSANRPRHDTIESFNERAQFIDADEEDERPNSGVNVGWHRAGDSISRNSIGVNAASLGVSGEIVPGSYASEQGEYLRRESTQGQ